MMPERTLRVLEFTRIRELLAEGALTAAGAEKCRRLTPSESLPEVEAAQAETVVRVVLAEMAAHHLRSHPAIRHPAISQKASHQQSQGSNIKDANQTYMESSCQLFEPSKYRRGVPSVFVLHYYDKLTT